MSRQSDQETARVEGKIDLVLFLVEHLMREMISRGALGEAALARIMDGAGKSVPALSNSEELIRAPGDGLGLRIPGLLSNG